MGHQILMLLTPLSGLSISQIRRPGLSSFAPGPASNALNKSPDLPGHILATSGPSVKYDLSIHIYISQGVRFQSCFIRQQNTYLDNSNKNVINWEMAFFDHLCRGQISHQKWDLCITPSDLPSVLYTLPNLSPLKPNLGWNSKLNMDSKWNSKLNSWSVGRVYTSPGTNIMPENLLRPAYYRQGKYKNQNSLPLLVSSDQHLYS